MKTGGVILMSNSSRNLIVGVFLGIYSAVTYSPGPSFAAAGTRSILRRKP